MTYKLYKTAANGESATADFGNWWRNATVNPVGGSLAMAGLAAGGTYLLANPVIRTIRNIFGQTDISEEDVEQLAKDKSTRRTLALLAGGATGLLALYLQADKKRPDLGLLSYNRPTPESVKAAWSSNGEKFYADFQRRKAEIEAEQNKPLSERLRTEKSERLWQPPDGTYDFSKFKMNKNGSFLPEPTPIHGIDYNRVISVPGATSLFQVPGMPSYDSNFGVSVVNAAPTVGTGLTTMGGILDSARDKFKSKLNFAGIVDTGVKTMVSNAAANAFTNALDGFVGLPASTRNKLITGGTWAGLVHALVN